MTRSFLNNNGISDAARRRAGKEKAGWLEGFFGRQAAGFVALGRLDPQRYERFSVRRIDFARRKRNAPRLWNLARDRVFRRPTKRPTGFEHDTIWLCFPGIDTADSSEAFASAINPLDLFPRNGLAFVFRGPAGIAGYTPEQCLRSTSHVLAAAEKIVQQFPGRRVGVFSFSAGTHLGFYVANQIGRLRDRPVDRFIAVSPGESIAYGIFSTWVTDVLANELEARGITKEGYDEAIASVTQKNNLEFLPTGRNLLIHAAARDTYIPIDADGGTNDLIRRLNRHRKNPTYIVHHGLDHVTLPLKLIVLQRFGRNPYLL